MMRRIYTRTIWLAMVAAECALGMPSAEQCSIAQTITSEEPAIEPVLEIQAQIRRTTEAREEIQLFYREFIKLLTMAQGREQELVKQLAYFTQHITEGELGIRVLEVRRILDMMLEIDDHVIVAALAPYLEASDRGLRSLVRDWFQYHDSVGEYEPTEALQPVNYSQYHGYIKGKLLKKEPVPKAFVDYIYKRPRYAFLAFVYAQDKAKKARGGTRSEGTDELLWAEHIISDAIWRRKNGFQDRFEEIKPQVVVELEKLSQHKAWWVRLYVAHIVRQHPELSTDAIIERLRQDKHELVHEAISQNTSSEKVSGTNGT